MILRGWYGQRMHDQRIREMESYAGCIRIRGQSEQQTGRADAKSGLCSGSR